MKERYAYAVARIRSLETELFSDAVIEQLLSCADYEQCLHFLADKGWGGADTPLDADAMLDRETDKIWEIVEELHIPMEKFDVLSYPKLYHNLKAAIKTVCTAAQTGHIFYDDAAIPGDKMLEIVRKKDFSVLPAHMREAAAEAYDTLLHTRDGQLCDVIVDRAALAAMYAAGQASDEPIIRDYAESTVAVADIKIAVRSQKTGKSEDFMKRSMADCKSLDTGRLIRAALSGTENLRDYLSKTAYADGADALMESSSAFERWCDDRIIETLRPQKYNPFTIGPVFAYVIARQNEIKTVRIILSGKLNEMPVDSIRERVREMYV